MYIKDINMIIIKLLKLNIFQFANPSREYKILYDSINMIFIKLIKLYFQFVEQKSYTFVNKLLLLYFNKKLLLWLT